jgi:hypothetical protein
MGYKLLGYVVWRGGRWYVRRRFPHLGRNLAIGGAVAVVVLGGAAALGAQRRANGA